MERVSEQEYSNFAAKRSGVRTRAQVRKAQQQEAELEKERGGLTKRQYWQQKVRCSEDVVKFYQLYHPEYPEILAKAIAGRLETLLVKHNAGIPLTEQEKQMLVPYTGEEESKQWDPMEDIQSQMLEAKIKLTEKRLEDLMQECN